MATNAVGRCVRGRRAARRRADAGSGWVALAGRRPGRLPLDSGAALGLRPARADLGSHGATALPGASGPEQPPGATAAGPLLAPRYGRRGSAPRGLVHDAIQNSL